MLKGCDVAPACLVILTNHNFSPPQACKVFLSVKLLPAPTWPLLGSEGVCMMKRITMNQQVPEQCKVLQISDH